MKENVGSQDSKFRMILGIVLVAAGTAGYAGLIPVASNLLPQATTALILVIIGTVLIYTGYTRSCALYSVLGKSTKEE